MMPWQTVAKMQEAYRTGAYSVTELVAYYLDRISQRNPEVNAFISVRDEKARQEAVASQERIEKKRARPLEGLPIAIKDNMVVKGERTTAGSEILSTYHGAYTATAVKKLREAGAIILGKTNLDEFAMGSSTEFSAFGPTKNPHDISRVPGGSSGGSAAAVADDLCVTAFGSDTGGSIRQPASFCGVVGFKPTYGRVSRYGLIAMSSSLDQIGPFAKTVEDAEIMYRAIVGQDPHDATTVPSDKSEQQKITSLSSLRLGIPKDYLAIGLDPEVRASFERTVQQLKDAGCSVVDVSLPLAKASLPVYYLLVTAEVSSNLARYDGVRYGRRADAEDMIGQYIATRTAGFGEEAKRRILLGTFTLSKGYRDKYYVQASRARKAIAQEFDAALAHIDAIISPTSPTPAFRLGEKFDDPLTMYISDLFTVPANIANLPAISLPAGFVRNLPTGIQIMVKRFGEERLFHISRLIESVVGKATLHAEI